MASRFGAALSWSACCRSGGGIRVRCLVRSLSHRCHSCSHSALARSQTGFRAFASHSSRMCVIDSTSRHIVHVCLCSNPGMAAHLSPIMNALRIVLYGNCCIRDRRMVFLGCSISWRRPPGLLGTVYFFYCVLRISDVLYRVWAWGSRSFPYDALVCCRVNYPNIKQFT